MGQTYYFDLKGARRVRDRHGMDFATSAAAIEHSAAIAATLRKHAGPPDPDLSVVVVVESGTEIHREFVFRKASSLET